MIQSLRLYYCKFPILLLLYDILNIVCSHYFPFFSSHWISNNYLVMIDPVTTIFSSNGFCNQVIAAIWQIVSQYRESSLLLTGSTTGCRGNIYKSLQEPLDLCPVGGRTHLNSWGFQSITVQTNAVFTFCLFLYLDSSCRMM